MKHVKGRTFAKKLGLPAAREIEALLKAQLITAVTKEVNQQGLTHAELSEKSKLPRSAVTGILSGSLQKVTLDRILKLVETVGLFPEIKLRRTTCR